MHPILSAKTRKSPAGPRTCLVAPAWIGRTQSSVVCDRKSISSAGTCQGFFAEKCLAPNKMPSSLKAPGQVPDPQVRFDAPLTSGLSSPPAYPRGNSPAPPDGCGSRRPRPSPWPLSPRRASPRAPPHPPAGPPAR